MSATDDLAVELQVGDEPRPLPVSPPIDLPTHPFGYRLGNPTARAVFASDNLSSCAYATEEIWGHGRQLGRFMLVPRSGAAVEAEHLTSAVVLADQAGAALAAGMTPA